MFSIWDTVKNQYGLDPGTKVPVTDTNTQYLPWSWLNPANRSPLLYGLFLVRSIFFKFQFRIASSQAEACVMTTKIHPNLNYIKRPDVKKRLRE
jgi:hypothetical protein